MIEALTLAEKLEKTPTKRTWDSVGRAYDYPGSLPREAAALLRSQDARIGELVEVLQKLLSANNYRMGVWAAGGPPDQLDYADSKLWAAIDGASAALAKAEGR